ncbi:hypothetical protein GFY24_36430 [Nocardia sp. SYP-A9097]|uniref:hypothetical protein n=1 Tax=Nocardia sp. SYP-A9097 TaxID=2663237 RepID=UPI00129A51AA|nr:hypothetical protein [Nocardia sp. SYP-A9097]MRH92846.1 hypothetical protein [Nocardia sp. SYP-A9097]
MADRVEIHADLLNSAGNKTADIRDRINAVLAKLSSALDGRGEPWGDDELGERFAAGQSGYLASRVQLLRGGGNMAGTFDNFASAQHSAATLLTGTDHHNAHTLR